MNARYQQKNIEPFFHRKSSKLSIVAGIAVTAVRGKVAAIERARLAFRVELRTHARSDRAVLAVFHVMHEGLPALPAVAAVLALAEPVAVAV